MFTYYKFKGFGNDEINAAASVPKKEVKLILHIVHGMTEHIGRYESLSERLLEYGILTFGMDLRGHGRNKGSKVTASLGKDGIEKTISDISFVNEKFKEIYPDAPVVMLGFSLGSFIVRDYLSRGKAADGAIIAGTGCENYYLIAFLKKTAEREIKKAGFDGASPLINKLSFGTYNKRFSPNKTSADWLISDEDEAKKYLNDPLCKRDISAGLFWFLLDEMQKTGKPGTYKRWEKSLPVLLISGKDDAVGAMGKAVAKIEGMMKKEGMENVKTALLDNCRHDIFHENKNGGSKTAEDIIEKFLKENMK